MERFSFAEPCDLREWAAPWVAEHERLPRDFGLLEAEAVDFEYLGGSGPLTATSWRQSPRLPYARVVKRDVPRALAKLCFSVALAPATKSREI